MFLHLKIAFVHSFCLEISKKLYQNSFPSVNITVSEAMDRLPCCTLILSLRKISEMKVKCPVQPLGNSEHLINNCGSYSLFLFSFSVFLDRIV